MRRADRWVSDGSRRAGMLPALAVAGLVALSLAGGSHPGRAWAHDPLDPRAPIGVPGHVVHSHDGTRAYRANGVRHGISVLDPVTRRVVREIATDEPVDLVALSPDERWLYGIGVQAGHLVVIETATERIVGRRLLRPPGERR